LLIAIPLIVANQAGKSKLGYWQLFTVYSQQEHGLRECETTGPKVYAHAFVW
jgi:hypothetical protein